jgi:erythromycin esterase-like protein
MGGLLAASHGRDLVSLGFAFHEGRYNAMKDGSLQANDAVPSVPGSAEAVFHATGTPRFLLDLGRVSRSDPESAWLDGEVEFRSIGSIAKDGFHRANIRRQYNAVIYLDRGTPSTLMR